MMPCIDTRNTTMTLTPNPRRQGTFRARMDSRAERFTHDAKIDYAPWSMGKLLAYMGIDDGAVVASDLEDGMDLEQWTS